VLDIGATGHTVRRHHAPYPRRPQLQAPRRGDGWKQAVEERDQGTFDWTTYEPIKSNR
jgi:hypothetical protein